MKNPYIAENIRRYRERANLTQQQLADKIGVSWEMISRYEREESSPLNKLDKISNALNVSQSNLIEKHSPTRYSDLMYKVPLFIEVPKSSRFTPNDTNYYYICPEWIIRGDKDSYAIDSSLVSNDNKEFDSKGVTYISVNIKPSINDYVLVKEREGLQIQRYINQSSNMLGKILAQEIRY